MPAGRRVQGQGAHVVPTALEDQLGEDAHPQAVFHHGENGGILHGGVAADVRADVLGVKDAHDVQIKAQGGHEEFLPRELRHGEPVPVPCRVVRGKDSQKGVVPEGGPVVAPLVLAAGEAQVYGALLEPAVDLLHAAHADVDGHVRIGPAELLDDGGQPVHTDAGVGGYPDALPAAPGLLGDLPLKMVRRLDQLPDGGQQALSGGGEAHAGAVPDQEGKAGLPLQGVHHVGEAGLGDVQLPGGPGEAARLHRRQQGGPFFGIHRLLSGHLADVLDAAKNQEVFVLTEGVVRAEVGDDHIPPLDADHGEVVFYPEI